MKWDYGPRATDSAYHIESQGQMSHGNAIRFEHERSVALQYLAYLGEKVLQTARS